MPAPCLLEVAYGLRSGADSGDERFARQLGWLVGEFLAEPPARLLPLEPRAALLAGEIRARRRIPPTGVPRVGRSKAEARVAWVLDIEIAATAWVAGCDLATADAVHFQAIADLIANLAPGAPPLRILPPPL